MAAQKYKKKSVGRNAFLNAYYPYAHLVKALNSLNSFKPCARLLENKKSGGCNEEFLPENNFQTSSTKHFPVKHQDFGGLETNQQHEIQTLAKKMNSEFYNF